MSWSEREEDVVQEAVDLIWREHGRVNGTPCYEAALRMLQCSRAAEERGFKRGVLTAAEVKAMTGNEALALVKQVENDHAVYAGNVFAVARWKQLRAIVLGAAAAEERGRRRVQLGTCRVYRHGCSDGRSIGSGPRAEWREYALPHPKRDNCLEWVALAPRDSAPADDGYCKTCNSINGTHQSWCTSFKAPRDSGKGFSNADEPFADLVAAKARK